VEIVTAGDLVISGDLDLSAYRYAGVNPHAQKPVCTVRVNRAIW